MTSEIEKLVENSKAPEALARLFDRIAEGFAEPLTFTNEDDDGEPTDKARGPEPGTHAR